MAEESIEMQKYFERMEKETLAAYSIAREARKKGFDPEERVDIPIARNMAERVEGLISAAAPELAGTEMTKRILELEKQYGGGAWEIALIIAEEVAKEKFCRFADKRIAMEVGIRTGMAYSTGGIVAAPLEGFIELRIKKRKDNKEYFSLIYAGPIRGAGGTAASVSVLIADYVRKKMGYDIYDPTDEEVKRYITEIRDYHERVSNLQYYPSEEEIDFMVRHVPVEINGDPTEKIEVSNYKSLPRIETNRIRGGLCLVIAEGLTQKSAKLWKRLQKWGRNFDLDWDFLAEFLELQKKIKALQKADNKDESQSRQKLMPNFTYIKDLVAGRPVLSYPMRAGGFRLRYGRTRTSGFSAAAIHPAVQYILNRYIAIGTQLKVERPGKAAAVTVCDMIEGPIVKLDTGDVLQVDTIQKAKEIQEKITEILFLGDILFNYGDFSENGHKLIPCGYNEEWHAKEIEKATVNMFGNLDYEKLSNLLNTAPEQIKALLKNPFTCKPDAASAVKISKELSVPLHPLYTYYWSLITKEQFEALADWFGRAKIHRTDELQKIILPMDRDAKRILELIGVPHTVATNEFVIIDKNNSAALLAVLNITDDASINSLRQAAEKERHENKYESLIDFINSFSQVKIRDKAGTFIGARMGRPEKAKMRKLTGSPHMLFPIGEEGGRLRCFQSALEAGKVTAEFPMYKCDKCEKETIYPRCETCGEKTTKLFLCKVCGPREKDECPKHGRCVSYRRRELDIKHFFDAALLKLKDKNYPDLVKGVKGTSNKDHIPENIVKGILRAKHDVYVNKDGTTRYDMSELPITHFKPFEIGTSIEKLKELGYTHDIDGHPLESKEQIIELKAQDVILPAAKDTTDEPADIVLFRVGNFIDDLLVSLYGMQPFYNFKKPEDVVGHIVVGLAPHISAGIIGRIIGFSQIQAFLAHPLFHAAMRRDCDGDEACVILLMDSLLNFSRQFLPDSRGSRTMDSPLVLTQKLRPSEVDDQAQGVDVVWSYPLEFYEACMEYKQPWDIKIEQIRHRLGTEKQYEGMGFTIPVSNINNGVRCSAYKTLPSMEDKLKGQMDIANKIRAVDESDVARLVIEKHFLKDTKGNLRKFSMQQFRCSKCNEKFRRPPLIGKCTKCGGNLIFTISEGSVTKYLGPSISLAEKYKLPSYMQQSLELLKRRVEYVFGKEKEKQTGLGAWFG